MAPKLASAPAKMRKSDPGADMYALALMLLIMIVLGSAYSYLQSQPGGAAMAQPAAIATEQKSRSPTTR